MNDPKENQLWSFSGGGKSLQDMYPEEYSHETHIDLQYKLGHEVKLSSQIICFVNEKPETGVLNEMMWAHYADNHRGICLEIDIDKFVVENKEQLVDYVFEPVSYGSSENPVFWADPLLEKKDCIKAFVKKEYKKLFLHKSLYWEHENEKRLLIFDPAQRCLSINESLTGLYMGLSFPTSYRPSIDNLIDETKTKIYDLVFQGHKIELWQRKKNDFRPIITRKILDNL
ncbi:MAG: DUF2971 domain-containing protein [Mucilaginibacter sp.]